MWHLRCALFIIEVKKLDGSNFPLKTLHDIVLCVQFHLEMKGFSYKVIDADRFRVTRFTMDNMMEIHTEQGLGNTVRQAVQHVHFMLGKNIVVSDHLASTLSLVSKLISMVKCI